MEMFIQKLFNSNEITIPKNRFTTIKLNAVKWCKIIHKSKGKSYKKN